MLVKLPGKAAKPENAKLQTAVAKTADCAPRKRERTILQCNHKNYAESKIKQKIALPTDTCVNIPLQMVLSTI